MEFIIKIVYLQKSFFYYLNNETSTYKQKTIILIQLVILLFPCEQTVFKYGELRMTKMSNSIR